MISYLDFKNYTFKKIASKISHEEVYKNSYAKFYIIKRKRNSNIMAACAAFENEYAEKSKSGTLVNDLRVQNQNGINITVKKMDDTIYETLNLATNSYNDLELEMAPRTDLVNYVQNEGLSSCLSRKIAGQLPIHEKLEQEICDFLNYDACLLATCGYIAQQAAMFGLFHSGDIIFSDQHNHSSLVDGMRLTNAKIIVYPHLDYENLETLIKKYRHQYNSAGIVSDGVFSAHGTIANLDKMDELKEKYNLITIIDDTHGFATVGTKRRGVLDHFNSKPDVLTASLAKGLAGFGGVIAGKKSIIRVIDCMGRQNINTSHLSPLVVAQSYFNLRHLRNNLSEISHELNERLYHFNNELEKLGIKQYQNHFYFSHPIFSFFAESESKGIQAYQVLLEQGFTGAFFPPPVSPKATIRLSLHRKVDYPSLTRLAHLLKELNLRPLSQEYWPLMSFIYKNPSDSISKNIFPYSTLDII